MSTDWVHQLKVTELREELQKRGQPAKGLKSDLQDRLIAYITEHEVRNGAVMQCRCVCGRGRRGELSVCGGVCAWESAGARGLGPTLGGTHVGGVCPGRRRRLVHQEARAPRALGLPRAATTASLPSPAATTRRWAGAWTP